MIKNYFKIALRNLVKRKGLTTINVLGLAVGLACCILIAIYVFYELSYDRFQDHEQLYRVTQTTETSAKAEEGATTPFPVGPALERDFPDRIANSVRFFDMEEESHTIRNKENERSYRVDDFYVVDSTFFDVMSMDLKHGDPRTALKEPMSAVITTELAEKFFDEDEDPIGQTLDFKGVTDFTVRGVMEPVPENSHLEIEMLVSFTSLEPLYGQSEFMERWFWNPCWTYVKLEEGASVSDVENQFSSFVDKNYTGREEGEEISLALQPITDIHLYSDLDQEISENGSAFYVYLFSAVAVLVLLIASINFTNLSIARSTERVREVAMRKAVGASRRQLFAQFMGESLLITLFSILLSLGMVYFSLPWFNDLLDMNLSFTLVSVIPAIITLIGLWLLVGVVAGMYPALYLSGFSPGVIMQGNHNSTGGQLFQKGLVVFQFTLSVMLIIGTVIVYLQIQHFQEKDLGYDKDQLVVMPIKQTLIAWEFDDFRDVATSSAHIEEVTGTSKVLGSEKQTMYKYRPADKPDAPPTNMGLVVTHDFLETYNMELLAGRSFSRERSSDAEESLLINRSMLEQLKLEHPEEALGETFYYTNSEDERETYQVVGVVEDFNYTSIKKEISPMVISLADEVRPMVSSISFATARLSAGNVREGLNDLEAAWEEINHIDPFTYSFMDEKLEEIYESETKMAGVSGIFALICIVIACMGLFGLASFTASLRTKEIGIRKALGATVSNIVNLLSADYLKLIILANIVSWPIVYYLAMQWLQDFPYRITLDANLIIIYGGVGLASVIICLATVSYHSFRAAAVNPVESIRRE